MKRIVVRASLMLVFIALSTGSVAQQIKPLENAPPDQQNAILHLHNGRLYYGRVLQSDGKLYIWQSPDGKTHRILAKNVADVVMLPPGVRPLMITTPQGATVLLPVGHLSWADAAVAYSPGRPRAKRVGSGQFAVGRPDWGDRGGGRSAVLGHGGVLVLQFIDNRLVDVPGPDLVIVEVGPKVEPTRVAISDDGRKWINVGIAQGANSVLDIGPFVAKGQQFRYVKLLDGMAGRSNDSKTPGADIDAVGTIGAVPASCSDYSFVPDYRSLGRKQP